MFLALSLAYVLLECWPQGAWLYFGTFLIARLIHSFLMLYPRQPWRTLCYALGILSMCAMSTHIFWAVFTRI